MDCHENTLADLSSEQRTSDHRLSNRVRNEHEDIDSMHREGTPESDKNHSSDDTDSDTAGSASEGEESSGNASRQSVSIELMFFHVHTEMDEEECDRRKCEYLNEMADLEKQFMAIKEQLYLERLTQVDKKLEEVRAGRSSEYLHPLEELQDNMRVRSEVSGILRDFRLTNVKCQYEAEMLAARQNFEVSYEIYNQIQ